MVSKSPSLGMELGQQEIEAGCVSVIVPEAEDRFLWVLNKCRYLFPI